MTHPIREAAEETTLKLVLHLENTDGFRVYDGSAGVTPSGTTAIANALLAARMEGMREEREACAQLIENWHVLRDGDRTRAKLAKALRARADEIEKEIGE